MEQNHELLLAVNILHDPRILRGWKKNYFNTPYYRKFFDLIRSLGDEWYTPEDVKLRLAATKLAFKPWTPEEIDMLASMEPDNMPATHLKALQKEFVEKRMAEAFAQGNYDEVMKQVENRKELMTEPEGNDLEGAANEIISDLERGEVESLSVGNDDLDEYLGGLRKGQVMVISGRPGMGKTALAINLAEDIYCANVKNKPEIMCEYFSLEMSKRELVERLLSRDTKTKYWKIRKGKCSDEEVKKVKNTLEGYKKIGLKVRSQGVGSLENVISCIRKQAIPGRYVAFIDHIGLLSVNGTHNEYERVSRVTNEMKQLALELNITIVLLAQLSRAAAQRDSKEPEMSDLRGSGSIEQDADIILMLHADDEALEQPIRRGIAKFTKNRAGKVGKMLYEFTPEVMDTRIKKKR